MHVKPAGVTQRCLGRAGIAFLRVQLAERESRSIVPPVLAREGFDQTESGVWALRFTKNFGFEADDFPNMRVILSRVVQNRDCAFVFSSVVTHPRKVYGANP